MSAESLRKDRSQSPLATPSEKPAQAGARRSYVVLGVALTAIAVVALALGLGLGLGLRDHHNEQSSSSTGTGLLVQSQDSSAFVLSMDMVNEPITTRVYNWTLEERTGAPDGVEKPMLVVNGKQLSDRERTLIRMRS